MVTHDFRFPDAEAAARFVFRLHKNLGEDIGTFRDGPEVRVFDVSERHTIRIAELARESSGTYSSSPS